VKRCYAENPATGFWRQIFWMIEFYLSILFLLFVLSAFFSGSETALFSLNKVQLIKFLESGEKKKKRIYMMVSDPEGTLLTILIGNMTVNVAASTIATGMFIGLFGSNGMWVSVIVLTILLLIFGEVTPKTFAVVHSESVSKFCSTPLYLLYIIVKRVRDLIPGQKEHVSEEISEDELKEMINIGHETGEIESYEQDMMSRVFRFNDITVDNLMTPRKEMIMISTTTPLKRIIKKARRFRVSRIPVYENNVNNIVGVLYVKDLLPYLNDDKKFDIHNLIREPIFVKPGDLAAKLFSIFKLKHVHIGIVINEYGHCVGLITIEDILEEVIGEIDDEFDVSEVVKND